MLIQSVYYLEVKTLQNLMLFHTRVGFHGQNGFILEDGLKVVM